jgi:hypothetical protein
MDRSIAANDLHKHEGKPESNTVTPLRKKDLHIKGSFQIEGFRPLVRPGIYEMALINYRTASYFRSPKLVLTFRIVTFGEFFGTEVDRFYNVKCIKGKPARRGLFKVGARSDFIREYCLISHASINRLDRISMTPLFNAVVTGKIETVKLDSRQRSIPEQIKYSRVSEIIGISND